MSKHDLIKFINDNEITLGRANEKTELRKVGEMGYGRFATDAIGEGDVIYRAGGLWLSDDEKLEYPQDYFQLVEGEWLFQGGLKYHLNGCHNHSCDPNAYVQELIVRALRRIETGEQITIDYAALIYHPFIIMEKCRCSSQDCRGTIAGSDWRTYDLPRKYGYKVNGHILEMWLRSQQT